MISNTEQEVVSLGNEPYELLGFESEKDLEDALSYLMCESSDLEVLLNSNL